MSVALDTLASCFQGLLPAMLFTCSRDGIPNAAYLSHVDYVDAHHVALSFQFFNKSRRNVDENPVALIDVPDPDTGQCWHLRLRFVRSETEGPLFDRMALRIEAIASYCGLKGIFKLRAADVYEVLSIEPVPEAVGNDLELPKDDRRPADAVFTMSALQDLAVRIQGADSLESLVDSILEGLDRSFGFKHSMLLVPSDERDVLVTIATRGYATNGAGAEVRFGEGIAGVVAEARKPIRIAGLLRGMLYAYAMHRDASDPRARQRRIPVPGLDNPESQLGVPLLVRGDLVGVLCLESDVPYRFHETDKASIELLGSYVAIAIQNMQLSERTNETEIAASPPTSPVRDGCEETPTRTVAYYTADECVFVDDEYLIRGLPAKILWKLLTTWEQTGRTEFTNRELRLDRSLSLPEFKDNLESRLLLLRRRLEQKCPDLLITARARGRFALALSSRLILTVRS